MRREEGFTLLEILVGLVLLGAFMSGIYTVAVGTLVAKRKIDETAAVFTAGPMILDLVEKDIRAIYFHGVQDLRAFKAQTGAKGGIDVTTMDMVTSVDSKVSVEVDGERVRSDITEVGYRVRESDDYPGVYELFRREQFFFDDDPVKGGEYYLVYDRIRGFKVEFFERKVEGETGSTNEDEEGKDAWDAEDEKALPHAARITLIVAPPPEISPSLEDTERTYTFVRWVLFPTAFDFVEEEKGPSDAGPGGPGGPGGSGR